MDAPLENASASEAPYTKMGPSLLAKQPITVEDEAKEPAAWEALYQHLEASLGSMRTWRYSWWSHWSRLAEYFLPSRYTWLVVANRMNRGSPINDSIIDGTPQIAVNICASGMWTGLTSPSRPWFELQLQTPGEEIDADAQEWLEDTQRRIYEVLGGSNFYTCMAQAFRDVTVFGTAPVIIYEDDADVIRCYLPCCGEYFLKAGARFSVDTLYREFVMTVLQIVEMFGAENLPPEVFQQWVAGGASLSNEFVVAHAIEPNFAISRPGSVGEDKAFVKGGFDYREIYWLKGKKTAGPLSKRGFRSKPFFAARWATSGNDPYGRSPCMDALGDDKQLQHETMRKGEFVEKLVRPPMGADPALKSEPSSILPASVTYVSSENGRKGFWPLMEMNATAFAPLTQDIEKISARIERTLFVDVFMAISRMEGVQPRNELELTKRDLERLQVLGPFITMFENESAKPAILRVIDIMQRRRMFRPMPESLRGRGITITYTSIMKMAQLSAEAVAAKDYLGTMGSLSAAAKAAGVPDPLRVVNLDKTARRYAEITNFWSDCLFTDDEVKKHDNARQQAQAAAQAPQLAMAGVSAAKTLSETQLPGVPGGSALAAMIGGQ